MLAPLSAVVPQIRASLDPAPLYTDAAKLNRDAPTPPYGLLLPTSQPEDPNAYDAALVATLDLWGPLWTLDEIADSLEWLDGHWVGRHEGLQNLRYRRQSRQLVPEPEPTFMPDGRTQVRHISDLYRVTFAHFPQPAPEVVP